MKIVADENIPFLEHYFARCGNLFLMPGRMIKREHVIDADILLVRSVTKINKELLYGTSVKFVGSATTGIDHIDTRWLESQGIKWYAAIGCNSMAVVEYVICVIAALQKQGLMLSQTSRAGVIGIGHVGSKVADVLDILGFEVVRCDPVRAENELEFFSTPLEDFSELDFVTLHTPLTFKKNHPTYHMIEKTFLQQQKSGCIVLNTGRGSVIDFKDVKQYGRHLHWCLDVWENEPFIDADILESAMIATPHIAGYSVQAKYRGVEMVYRAALQQKIIPDHQIAIMDSPRKILSFEGRPANWRDVVLTMYDPMITSFHMKKRLQLNENKFDQLRKDFIDRYEFACVDIQDVKLDQESQVFLRKIGIKV